MNSKLVLAAAMIAASAAIAQAEGYNWNAYYGGLHGGWASGEVSWVDNNGGWFTFAPGTAHAATSDGFIGGAQIGVLRQWGKFVGGLELSASATNISTSVVSPLFPGSDTWQTDISSLVTATARAGFAIGSVLPYIEGGYAGGNVNVTNLDVVFCGALTCIFDSSEWRHGYTVGGGIDFRVNKNVSAGLNYRFADLGSDTHAGITVNNGTVENYTVDSEVHTVTFRINLLFTTK